MKSFNLSAWALRHRALVTYFMLMIVVAGIASYFKLGRSEDPDFTVKTMVVGATWPGATVEDTLEQITDRLERKLQETPSLDYVKSYTSAGRATIFVNLKDSTPPADVPDIWYQVRKKVRDVARNAAAGRHRSRLRRRVRRHLRHRLRLHRQRLHRARAARLRARHPQAAARAAGHLQDRHPGRAGRARVRRVLAREARRARHRSHRADPRAREPERRHAGRRGANQRREDSGACLRCLSVRAGRSRHQFRRRRPHDPPGRHRPGHARPRRSGAADVPRQRPARHRHRDRHAHGRRRHDARTQRGRSDGADHGVPAGRHRAHADRQPDGDRRARGRRVHESPVGGDRHRARRQLAEPGPARRRGRGAVDPAGAGGGVRGHELHRHRPTAHLARRADHRARPAGRRRHDHRRIDGDAARARRRQGARRHLCLHLDRVSRCSPARW